MLDPYEAVLNLALDDSALVTATGGRIALEHKYGQDSSEWALNASSLIFRPVGGFPDRHWQRVQMEAYCYGDTPADCGLVYEKLIEFLRTFENGNRQEIEITEGTALVYYISARANARLIVDDAIRPLGMPAYLALIEAAVSESTVI